MHNRRKKRNKQIKVLIVIFFFLAISILFLNNKTNITKLERVIKTSAISIVDFCSYPVDVVETILIEKRTNKELEIENKKLKETISEYQEKEALFQKTEKERQQLENSIDLKLIESNSVVVARVINRNVGAWYNELTINKGEKSGLKIGNSVIVKNGLIGNVIKLTDYYATVKLITSSSLENISVEIGNSQNYKYGIVKKYQNNKFEVEVLDGNEIIEKGMLVTTTGLTTNYPKGIILGYVEDIELDNFGLSEVALVKSNVDFNKITYVEVIKGVTKWYI